MKTFALKYLYYVFPPLFLKHKLIIHFNLCHYIRHLYEFFLQALFAISSSSSSSAHCMQKNNANTSSVYTQASSPTGTVGPTWDEDSSVGHVSQARLMAVLCLFFSLVNSNKSTYWIKERPMRRGERVKLWEKQRPLHSLRELLPALNSLLKLGLPRQFMTSWDHVSLLFLYFGLRCPVEMDYSWIGFRLFWEKGLMVPARSQYSLKLTLNSLYEGELPSW